MTHIDRKNLVPGSGISPPGTKIRSLFPALLIFVALLPFTAQEAMYSHYTNDDAYITYRYSRNLVRGIGPFFNPGEHVEGYTNFLQMLQTALFILLAGPSKAPGLSKILGVLYGAGCVVLTFLLFRRLFPETERGLPRHLSLAGATLAAAMVGISPAFAVNGTSGLETTMFAFLFCLGMLLGVKEVHGGRWYGAGIAFSLAELTRPEGSLLFAAFWIGCAAAVLPGRRTRPDGVPVTGVFGGYFRERRVRLLFSNGLLVTTVFLAQMAFRYLVYDGELLPNTYYAKKGGFWGFTPWQYLWKGLAAPLFGAGGLAAAAAGFLANIRRSPFPRSGLGVLAAVAVGVMMPFLAGTDWMVGYRLMMPYLPAAAVVAAGGWTLLLARTNKAGPLVAAAVVIGTAVLLWFAQDAPRRSFYRETFIRARGYQTGHRAAAEWIRSRALPGDGIALMDIGIIGYTCIDQTIIDITGLTDRTIAKAGGTFLDKNYDPDYVFKRKPRFIVLTLFARGQPYTVPEPGTRFQPWTGMEGRLMEHPDFRRFYARPRVPSGGETVDWLDSFAAQIGAERAFEHGHPRMHCVQAVFRRQHEPVSGVIR